jgi:hypothetical protein
VIEPVGAHRFQNDPCAPTLVHGRHPVWTGLEPAKVAQGNFQMVRD